MVCIVSAMSGITDKILGSADAAVEGSLEMCELTCNQMKSRYTEVIEHFVKDSVEAKKLEHFVDHSIEEFRSICNSIGIIGECGTRVRDLLVARGERFTAQLFTAALKEKDKKACFLDATRLIFLSKYENQFEPNIELCEQNAVGRIHSEFERHEIMMVPGFIGVDPNGSVRTLGRGGSDYSATILAGVIEAKKVTLYKDVDGMLTADPRYVSDVRVIPELHYREAAELSYYGAKVLHPRTIIPLAEKKIPLIIKNTLNPNFQGTYIGADINKSDYPVKALTAISGQAMVSIEGRGLIGVPGIAAKAFTAIANASISVSFITQASSEASICFMIPEAEIEDAKHALNNEFKWEIKNRIIDTIKVKNKLSIVAVVGYGMVGRPGIASRTFSAISKNSINLFAIAQGSSELNISFAVESSQAGAAIKALHQEYQLHKLQALPDRQGKVIDLCIYGLGQIGRSLSKQIMAQKDYFENTLHLQSNVVGVADRSGMWMADQGLDTSLLDEAIAIKKEGKPLFSQDDENQRSYAKSKGVALFRLFEIPLHRGIFVDLTADDTYNTIISSLEHNLNCVLANKRPVTVDIDQYDQMFALAREKGLSIRYEATVGAGLPVLDTIQKLDGVGDKISSIEGCLSGTLGYLFTQIEDGKLFSEAVEEAYKLGYTEPHPKDDLSGTDIARKTLILARAMGYRVNLSDISVKPLYDNDQIDDDPRKFISNLKAKDGYINELFQKAITEKKTLRYVSKIEEGKISVGLEAVSENSPLGRLRGTNNQVMIYSARYKQEPLIVTGPGAGAEVTASGVLNDIIAIATKE